MQQAEAAVCIRLYVGSEVYLFGIALIYGALGLRLAAFNVSVELAAFRPDAYGALGEVARRPYGLAYLLALAVLILHEHEVAAVAARPVYPKTVACERGSIELYHYIHVLIVRTEALRSRLAGSNLERYVHIAVVAFEGRVHEPCAAGGLIDARIVKEAVLGARAVCPRRFGVVYMRRSPLACDLIGVLAVHFGAVEGYLPSTSVPSRGIYPSCVSAGQ